MTNIIRIDRKHRVKKTRNGWLPQWRKFLFWRPYTLWVCDNCIGGMEMYDKRQRPPYFKTDKDAVEFVKTAIDAGYEGCYHIGFDMTYPNGIC